MKGLFSKCKDMSAIMMAETALLIVVLSALFAAGLAIF